VIHQVEHQLFEDHTEAARADLTMQSFLGDGLRGFFVEMKTNALIFKELLILLDDGVARFGENFNQSDFVEFVENAHDREASDKFGDEAEFDQVLWLGLAEQFGVALQANAAGFFGGGIKLAPVGGEDGRISPDRLAEALAGIAPGQLHRGQPSAVSVTQASDLGTVYSLAEIHAIAEVAKARGLRVHMDGARFANALARLGCTPAEASWRAGIDIMSFGATKNGGALCDAIVVFAPELADGLAVQLRRAGQVWSKMRFASAQLIAYVENGLWLEMARASNSVATRIAVGLTALPSARLLAPVEANEIFLELPDGTMDALERDGFQFYRRSRTLARFVCRFDTTEAEADALLAALRRHLAPVAARAAE